MLETPPKEGEPLAINGSAMMAVAASREEVLAKMNEDVYARTGVWDMDKVCYRFLYVFFRDTRWLLDEGD